jgi:oxygen-independent coproporphyrinogen-3 oxidase
MDLSPDDRLRRDIIQKLMCDGEVALNSVAQEFGIDAESYFAKELSQLASETTLATVDAQDANTVRCTPLGRVLARNVCQVFDRYNAGQPRNTTNFSSTI